MLIVTDCSQVFREQGGKIGAVRDRIVVAAIHMRAEGVSHFLHGIGKNVEFLQSRNGAIDDALPALSIKSDVLNYCARRHRQQYQPLNCCRALFELHDAGDTCEFAFPFTRNTIDESLLASIESKSNPPSRAGSAMKRCA